MEHALFVHLIKNFLMIEKVVEHKYAILTKFFWKMVHAKTVLIIKEHKPMGEDVLMINV